ncbi:MAG: hypothetical protein M1825_003968 [Sarcosagium campestre]|nr:MAG: hypothetical protein M1825_003968 [Sarcosagium campestre]
MDILYPFASDAAPAAPSLQSPPASSGEQYPLPVLNISETRLDGSPSSLLKLVGFEAWVRLTLECNPELDRYREKDRADLARAWGEIFCPGNATRSQRDEANKQRTFLIKAGPSTLGCRFLPGLLLGTKRSEANPSKSSKEAPLQETETDTDTDTDHATAKAAKAAKAAERARSPKVKGQGSTFARKQKGAED